MSDSTWRPGYRACATSTRCWMPPCYRSTSTSPCSPPWGPPGPPPQLSPLRRLPLALSLPPLPPASPALRPPPHPQEPPHQPLNPRSLQLLSQRALRSCLKMGSLMQRSCAAAAYKSWSPLLPTDNAPVLTCPLSSSPRWDTSCHQVPAPSLPAPGSSKPQL